LVTWYTAAIGVIGTRHLEFTSADRTTHAATYDVTVTRTNFSLFRQLTGSKFNLD